jgi:hypothetical protein
LDFLFENIPSGNPVAEQFVIFFKGMSSTSEGPQLIRKVFQSANTGSVNQFKSRLFRKTFFKEEQEGQ